MVKNFKLRNIISQLFCIILIIIFASMFWDLWNSGYRNWVFAPFYEKGALLFVFEYLFIYIIFMKIYEGNKIDYLNSFDLIYSQTLSLIISNFIIYIQMCLLTKMIVTPIPLLYMTLKQFCIIIVWAVLSKKIYSASFPPLKMLVINGNASTENLIKKMNKHTDKYIISNMVESSVGIEKIIKSIDKHDAVIISDVESQLRNEILKYCFSKSVRTYITPKISDIIISNSEKLHILDTPLLIIKNGGIAYYQRIIKRLMDLLLSFLALIIASPFMLIVAILIKLCDSGSIIYKQKRLTINNKEFYLYKFRSMYEDAEKDGKAVLARENDDRITPIGRIIRKIRFDELPQLINIFKGDMSIVGPRPERPEITEKYMEDMPEFSFRTKVKAGLTGYAQVIGKYNTTAHDKLKLDLMYIENYSLMLDFKLMIMTVKILFKSESTEGVVEKAN